jgi:hypothetical protein
MDRNSFGIHAEKLAGVKVMKNKMSLAMEKSLHLVPNTKISGRWTICVKRLQ